MHTVFMAIVFKGAQSSHLVAWLAQDSAQYLDPITSPLFFVHGSSYSCSVGNLVQTENALEYELIFFCNTKLPIIPSMNYVFTVCIGPRPCAFAVYGMTGRMNTGIICRKAVPV